MVAAAIGLGIAAWQTLDRETSSKVVGEELRTEAYNAYAVAMSERGVTGDRARAFVDRWHKPCLDEAAPGHRELILPAVQPAYKECLARAFREGH
jgi:hypothetical protein